MIASLLVPLLLAATDAGTVVAPVTGASLVQTDVVDFTAFVDAVAPKIVYLELQDAAGNKVGSGSGFIVRSSGVVVTNEHVAENGQKIVAVFKDKTRVEVTGAWARDPAHDIALLQLAPSKSPDGYAALVLGESVSLRPGVPIAVVGSPLGFSHSLSNGVISAIRENGLEKAEEDAGRQRLLQLTAPISPGSSGSPVMQLDGRVIGVATLAFQGRAQALNFAVPIEIVLEHLATLDAKLATRGTSEGAKEGASEGAKEGDANAIASVGAGATATPTGIQPNSHAPIGAAKPAPLVAFPWKNLAITAVFLLGLLGLLVFLSRRERR